MERPKRKRTRKKKGAQKKNSIYTKINVQQNTPRTNALSKIIPVKVMEAEKPAGSIKYQPIDLAPFPPKIDDSEDFSKDNIDLVEDTVNEPIATTSITPCPSTTKTEASTVTEGKDSKGFVITGCKIPVRMLTPAKPALNKFKKTKEEGQINNQQLKDCLSSDIVSVVKDKIKANEPKHVQPARYHPPLQHPSPIPLQYPRASGVPRSFLTRTNQTVIEPQSPAIEPPPVHHFIPTIQNNQKNQIPGFAQQPIFEPTPPNPVVTMANPQTFVQTPMSPTRYSPTDLYKDYEQDGMKNDAENREDSASPDIWQSAGDKRVSAFDRLGPISEPKKPKLTINLSFDKEQAVREVVDEESQPQKKVYVPVHEREDILQSTDETVRKYVGLWPWMKNVGSRRSAKNIAKFPLFAGSDTSAAVGHSKTAMLMVKEQMDEVYRRDNSFLGVTVTGYPASWTKEDVLDTMLENLKGKSFIPCFIEFNEEECKFIVVRSRMALLAIHELDFRMQRATVQLQISIAQLMLSLMQLDFIPRLILRKRLAVLYEDHSLDLNRFTLQPDISHFIYYPLHHLTNQMDLMEMQTDVKWSHLTKLDLSHNRLTSIEGFDIPKNMPKLRSLNLSHNSIEKALSLLPCRTLPLHSLWLEGNPLCHDYIEPDHYVTVMKTMFPMMMRLDDVPVNLKGDLPALRPNYCPHDTAELINNFLQIYIPLLDSQMENRLHLQTLYADDALVTITYRPKLGLDPHYNVVRILLLKSRVVLEGNLMYLQGRADIEKILRRWPNFEHDPFTFTIDVLFHNESSTIFRLDGVMKLLADSLAENEHLIAFSKTIHLHTVNQYEYKIKNEMIYFDDPTEEFANAAFRRTAVQRKPLSFKLETPPDDHSKKRLIDVFMKLTQTMEKVSKRCLELKDWDLREALAYFMKLYKMDNMQPLFDMIATESK